MKTFKYTIYALFGAMIASSCSDTWDEHYTRNESQINSTTITEVKGTLTEYMAKESSLSSMYQLFEETGMIEELSKRKQLYTILTVKNEAKAQKAASENDIYTAQTYISDVCLSPSNAKEWTRILMWSGKNLDINVEVSENGEETIRFNNAKTTQIIKLDNGYLYVLDQMVDSPRSIYETIERLGDEYSIFRELVMSKNRRIFNKDASTIIGVDNTGNTVYDSIFTTRSPFFEDGGFDIMSENMQGTMLIPSNTIINKAMDAAHKSLEEWGLEREDSILKNWIIQSTFFNGVYTRERFENEEEIDLKSALGKQWRTTVQKVNLDNPMTLSNGIAYYVTDMKIPTNVLIYRLKDFYYYYKNLTEKEKTDYFKTENLIFNKVKDAGGHDGWPAMGFPRIPYLLAQFDLADKNIKSYTLDFTPFKYKEVGASGHETTPYLIPAGTYDVFFGFEQDKKNRLGNIKVFINGEHIGTISETAHNSTNFHYDRGGSGGYPEGYSSSAASKAGVGKAGNYGLDGGKVGTVTLTGEAKPIVIRFETSGNSLDKALLFHWCLKPTADCY